MAVLTPSMREKLKKALYPKSVALVGASPEQLSVGFGPLCNILSRDSAVKVFPVNPKYQSILGIRCYKTLEEIEEPIDLVVFLVNHKLATDMIPLAAKLGIKAGVIVAGGFKELKDGKEMEKVLVEKCIEYEFPVIGPNTLGFSNFLHGFHGIFWHLGVPKHSPTPLSGIAVISQSGGVGLTISYNLESLGLEPALFVGVGNRSVVDFEDYIQVLKDDERVKVFTLFIEGLDFPRGLYETLKELSDLRHFVVYKAGKREEVERATTTHTGAVVGNYALYQTMFEQSGTIEVQSTWEAAVISKALDMVPLPSGNRLCILTFTAGPSIVAMDILVEGGWVMPDFSEDVIKRVRAIIGEKTPVDLQNPMDLTGPGFIPQTYVAVMEEVLKEDFDAYLFVWNYNGLIRVPLLEWKNLSRKFPNKSMVFVVLANSQDGVPIIRTMAFDGLCGYLTPEDGAKALNGLLLRKRFIEGK